MPEGRYCAYYRVSTGKQGRSGLGLDAQRATVAARLNSGSREIIGEFTEIESGTAKRHRPELERALSFCRVMHARLIVANVSRLTRDPDFMRHLANAGVEVEFCDLPKVEGPVGTFILRQMLSVAELEAGMIAERTKKALAAAKARGQKLGGNRGNLAGDNAKGRAASIFLRREKARGRASDLLPIMREIRAAGASSMRDIAAQLNARASRAPRGGEWSPMQVRRVLASAAN
jgi:DNA invertase Pin-like site-specific DNA recombinase